MTPLMVTVPAESVPPVPPPLVVPKGARTATSPVGVPVAGATGLTVTVAVTAVPWVIGAGAKLPLMVNVLAVALKRSEERRVGKEWRFGWWQVQSNNKEVYVDEATDGDQACDGLPR